ncbi:MAG: SPFH domain-containing protein [Candidatus Caldarchaeum sp.]|nr:SPFH domain-containing protein [Candidatus Caldarchaeum sp.]
MDSSSYPTFSAALIGLETVVPLFFLTILLLIILSSSIKVVTEYERAVIFRLGRLIGIKGPGVVIILPIIDRRRIIDLRLVTFDVPKQRIITRDNVTVDVDAIVYFRLLSRSKTISRPLPCLLRLL